MCPIEFDPNPRALINPEEQIPPVEAMPQDAVLLFADDMVRASLEKYRARPVAFAKSVCGDRPIYRCTAEDGFPFALVSMMLGGPAAAGCMEEMIAMGVKRFLAVGSCGVLVHELTAGHLIVPQAAVRDEGVSYHYLPPADEVALDGSAVNALCASLEALGAPYARTKTWTTDAFYRETPGKIAKNKARGCAVVEMECASMAAVAKFRGVPFAQLLWAGDSLAGTQWDKRNLSDHGMGAEDLYFAAALGALKRMAAAR